jgi:hypothetical protein
MTEPRDRLHTELVQAIRRSDAILYVVARPSHDGLPGELVIDWGADGMSRRAGALLLRDLATQWDSIADTEGEPPLNVDLVSTADPIETTEDFR